MQFRQSVLWLLAVVFIAISAILLIRVTALATSAQQTIPCAEDWYESTTPEVLDRCSQAKRATDVSDNRTAAALSDLQPTVPPIPTSPGTPGPPPPIPAADQSIEQINLQELEDSPGPRLRGANSLWQIGAITGADPYDYDNYFVMARPPAGGTNATLTTVLLGETTTIQQQETYQKGWVCPQDVGVLIITAVTGPTIGPNGPTGVVSFTTQGGKTGSFNMATQSWTFNP